MVVYYPKANRTAQWFGGKYSGSLMAPDRIVWHTTESAGFPGYSQGASAPHLTYHPTLHQWRQHFSLDRSSRALRNLSGGVETNTDDVIQVEIIAYSDEKLAAQRGHLPVSRLDSRALDDLAEFSRWANSSFKIPLTRDTGWVNSNYRNPKRMTNSQWRSFKGHTGHNRVPENTHWDPAALNIDEILRRARAGSTPPPQPKPEENFMAYIDNDAEFFAALDRYFDKRKPQRWADRDGYVLSRLNPGQNRTDNMHPVKRAISVAPWHQILGKNDGQDDRPLINMHAVMGALYAAAQQIQELPALITEAGTDVGLTPEQIEQMASSVASRVDRVKVVVENPDNDPSTE